MIRTMLAGATLLLAAVPLAAPVLAQSQQEALEAHYDRAVAAGYKALMLCSAIAIAERNGWRGFTGDESPARRAWRTRIIYTTNATTSYNAGREAQIAAGGYPFKVYRHNDASAYPRPQHLAWNGTTLPVDDPFWAAHSPQNGWGCKCYVSGARSERGARRLGGDPAKGRPPDWDTIDPKTGVPVGIDKGWDYAPGASVAREVGQMAEKTLQWDYQLSKAYMQEAPNRDALAKAYRALPSVADDVRRYAQAALAGKEVQPYRTMGLLTGNDAATVKALTKSDVGGFNYALDRSAVGHVAKKHGNQETEASRGQRAVVAEDYGNLPNLLNGPDTVEDGGLSDVGRPVVVYGKQIGEGILTAAFEVRKGRRMLALQSMWIKSRP